MSGLPKNSEGKKGHQQRSPAESLNQFYSRKTGHEKGHRIEFIGVRYKSFYFSRALGLFVRERTHARMYRCTYTGASLTYLG